MLFYSFLLFNTPLLPLFYGYFALNHAVVFLKILTITYFFKMQI